MGNGHKYHLKRLAAPKSWMLGKLEGTFAIKPHSGPHRKLECIPIAYILSRFLKYSSNKKETAIILRGKNVKVNGKAVTTKKFPVGVFDVISIEKTNEHFRLLFNPQKKFHLHKISEEESNFRVAKITNKFECNDTPFIQGNCGHNLRFQDPKIEVGDCVKIHIEKKKVIEYVTPAAGHIVYAYKGASCGRIGKITSIQTHGNKAELCLVDFEGHTFAASLESCMIIGTSEEDLWISLPDNKGVKYTLLETVNQKLGVMNVPEVVEVEE